MKSETNEHDGLRKTFTRTNKQPQQRNEMHTNNFEQQMDNKETR